MFKPDELSKLYDLSSPEESIIKFFRRKVYSCLWPDGQLHEGLAPLLQFTDGPNTTVTILPNPFYVRAEKLHWLSFATVSKKYFRVDGTCIHPSNIEITPALYDASCDTLLTGKISLLP